MLTVRASQTSYHTAYRFMAFIDILSWVTYPNAIALKLCNQDEATMVVQYLIGNGRYQNNNKLYSKKCACVVDPQIEKLKMRSLMVIFAVILQVSTGKIIG